MIAMSQQLEVALIAYGALFALSLLVSLIVFSVAMSYEVRDRLDRRRAYRTLRGELDQYGNRRIGTGLSSRWSA